MTRTMGQIIAAAFLLLAFGMTVSLFASGNGWIAICGLGGWLLLMLVCRYG